MKSKLRSSRLKLLVAGALLAGFMAGNGWGQISGPQLGYVFDKREGTLRPILGVSGASHFGDPLNLEVTLALVAISPKQDYALGVTQGEDGKIVLITFGGADQSSSVSTVDVAGTGASRITLSRKGRSAALLFPDSQSLKILTGLPEALTLTGEVDLRLAGLPEALALDDEGTLVLLASPENQGSRVFAYSQAGLQSLGVFGKVSALKLSGDRQALVADRETQEVILIRDVLGNAQRLQLATKEDGIHDPVAVEFSREDRRVFVANAGSGGIASLSLDGGPASLTFCECMPTGLEKLNGEEVFRLTEVSEKPLLMFEAGAAESRVVFVPLDNRRSNLAVRKRRAVQPITTRRSRLP